RYQTFYTGVTRIPYRTPFAEWAAIHGLFAFALLSLLLVAGWALLRRDRFGRLLRLVAARWQRLPRIVELFAIYGRAPAPAPGPGLIALAIAWAMAAVVALTFSAVAGFLGAVLALALGLALALRAAGRPGWLFALGIVALGALLGSFCEVLALKGDIGRMNTVFKLYFQVWTLWAGLGAAAAGWTVSRLRGSGR